MEGAVFNGKHSEKDYSAIMNYARITPPSVKENYVDIAGGNSSIDLTEAVGGVVFEDGKISFQFTFFSLEDMDLMKNDLHGRRMTIELDRDSGFYYEGRLTATSEKRTANLYELQIEARVKPYKLEKQLTIHNEEITTESEIMLINSRMPVMPAITVQGNIRVSYDGVSFALETGVYEIPEIMFQDGFNRMHVSGKGSICLEYRKGVLI